MKVLEEFKKYCERQELDFKEISNVRPYNNSTLFCIAGMQKYYDIFLGKKKTKEKKPICNNQPVLRMNDESEIGDGTHFLYFNMLGYFDFRKDDLYKRYRACRNFWLNFLYEQMDIKSKYCKFINRK